MSSLVADRPHCIHLGLDDRGLARSQDDARSRGMSVLHVSLTDVHGTPALVERLADALMFPVEVTGLDAVVSLMSDLDWFGNEKGYLVVARGLAEGADATDAFVSILPNVVDRWRSRATDFVVVLDSSAGRLQRTLAAANLAMRRAGELPWAQPGTGPVDVVVHRDEQPVRS